MPGNSSISPTGLYPRGTVTDCATGRRSDSPLRYRALAWEKILFFHRALIHKKVIVKDIWSAVNSSREPLNATVLTSMRNESSRESCRFQLRRRSNTTRECDEVDELIHPHGDHPFADVYTSHYHD